MARCSFCDWDNEAGSNFCANPDCGRFIGWKSNSSAPQSVSSPPPATDAPPTAAGPKPAAPIPVAPVTSRRKEPVQLAPEKAPTAGSTPKYKLTRQRAEPVLVERVDEPAPPTAQPGTSIKDGKQGLFVVVDQPTADVAPGGVAIFPIRIHNTGALVERITVGVADLPSSWVRVDPPDVKLDVGEEAVASLQVSPPRDASVRPGPLVFTLSAWSTTNPNVRCQQPCRLNISDFAETRMAVEPLRATGRGPFAFQLSFHNTGNQHLRGRPVATSETARVDLKPPLIEVPPGRSADVEARLVPGTRLITGTPTLHMVSLSFDGTPPVQGGMFQYQQLPRLSRLAARVLFVATLLVVALGVVAARSAWINRDRAVPDVIGKTQEEAQAALDAKGFVVVAQKQTSESSPGSVIDQVPAAETKAAKGAEVTIVVSAGPAPRVVPNLRGMSTEDAKQLLEEQGLVASVEDAVEDETYDAGVIVSQDPEKGAPVEKGTTVKIVPSKGQPQVTVPDLYLLTLDVAKQIAATAGLRVEIADYTADARFVNQVLTQNPDDGTTVPKGSVINVTIGIAPG